MFSSITDGDILSKFKSFDKNNIDEITIAELIICVRDLNLPLSKCNIEKTFSGEMVENEMLINSEQFLFLFRNNEKAIFETYQQLNIQLTKSNAINQILYNSLNDLGFHTSDEEIIQFIQYLKNNNNNNHHEKNEMFSYTEFLVYLFSLKVVHQIILQSGSSLLTTTVLSTSSNSQSPTSSSSSSSSSQIVSRSIYNLLTSSTIMMNYFLPIYDESIIHNNTTTTSTANINNSKISHTGGGSTKASTITSAGSDEHHSNHRLNSNSSNSNSSSFSTMMKRRNMIQLGGNRRDAERCRLTSTVYNHRSNDTHKAIMSVQMNSHNSSNSNSNYISSINNSNSSSNNSNINSSIINSSSNNSLNSITHTNKTSTTTRTTTTAPSVDTHPAGDSTKNKMYLSIGHIQLISGAVAGVISRTGTAPIDRVRTLMQVGGKDAPTGLWTGLRNIYRQGGFVSFYQGNGINCFKVAPETAVKMYTFELTKAFFLATNNSDSDTAPATSMITITTANSPSSSSSSSSATTTTTPDDDQQQQVGGGGESSSNQPKTVNRVTFKERFFAGCLAGAVSQTLIYPLELIKTRITVATPGTYKHGIYSCIKGIIKHEGGVTTMYKGLGLSVLGIMPYSGLDLMTNSILRDVSKEYYHTHYNMEPGVMSLLLCGMISSTLAMVTTYPIGMMRVRLQAAGMPGSVNYKTPSEIVQKIARTEGIVGFFRGVIPSLVKVVPASTISYAVYGMMTKHLSDVAIA